MLASLPLNFCVIVTLIPFHFHNIKILFYRLKDEESHGQKSFFTEIIASITDMKFANDGRHILSRDFMNLKVFHHSYHFEYVLFLS